MATLRIKIVHLWDKIARYVPLMETIKRCICFLRWNKYKRQIRKHENIAKSLSGESKILVLLGTGIGNAVESTPFVQAIRMIWPKAWLAVQVPTGNLFDNWLEVNHIVHTPQDLKGLSFEHTFVSWGGSISANKGYCHLGQIHYTEQGRNIICTKPEREYNIDMLRRLGYDGPTPLPYVSMQKPTEQIAPGQPRLCLVPGGTRTYQWRYKQWPYFDKLTRILLEKYPDAGICILGTKQDDVPVELFSSDNVFDLRGKLTLPETAWVLNSADIAIGNDCGPMHITGATQTPSIVIFGPTSEIKNAPAGKYVALRHKTPCAPCQYDRRLFTCKNPVCMNELNPDIVLEQVTKLLENTGHSNT